MAACWAEIRVTTVRRYLIEIRSGAPKISREDTTGNASFALAPGQEHQPYEPAIHDIAGHGWSGAAIVPYRNFHEMFAKPVQILYQGDHVAGNKLDIEDDYIGDINGFCCRLKKRQIVGWRSGIAESDVLAAANVTVAHVVGWRRSY